MNYTKKFSAIKKKIIPKNFFDQKTILAISIVFILIVSILFLNNIMKSSQGLSILGLAQGSIAKITGFATGEETPLTCDPACETGFDCTNGACVAQTPACTDTCASLGFTCGTQTVCGVSAECGTCETGYTCISGTCVADEVEEEEEDDCSDTCSSLNYECGLQTICGEVNIDCGTCETGYTCTSGTCVAECIDTCSSLGFTCGTQTICGASAECGTCETGYTCASGVCAAEITTTTTPNTQVTSNTITETPTEQAQTETPAAETQTTEVAEESQPTGLSFLTGLNILKTIREGKGLTENKIVNWAIYSAGVALILGITIYFVYKRKTSSVKGMNNHLLPKFLKK